MPNAVQIDLLLFAESPETVLEEHLVEFHPIDPVDPSPGPFPRADRIHSWPIRGLPLVDERFPVDVESTPLAEGPEVGDDALAPVHHRAERIEDDRFDRHAVHRILLRGDLRQRT